MGQEQEGCNSLPRLGLYTALMLVVPDDAAEPVFRLLVKAVSGKQQNKRESSADK